MPLVNITNHPQRVALANELHARPFPRMSAPSRVAYLAVERKNSTSDADRDSLIHLLEHFGAPPHSSGANHHFADLGLVRIKWEQHSEFFTFTLYCAGLADKPFCGQLFEKLPPDWLASLSGRILTSALVRIEPINSVDEAQNRILSETDPWFVRESLAASQVLDGAAVVASDFRLDPNQNIRFAVFPVGKTGSHRIGRIVQRLLEIETYKSMAMLTLPVARDILGQLEPIDRDLSKVVGDMADDLVSSQLELDQLLNISARIEMLSAKTAFRFSAAVAYSAIVNQRISVLREERLHGLQLFGEFMMRRFDPAIRTCLSAKSRLDDISGRAARASRLLGTRVGVHTNQQNKVVLEQMDRRAALQLRLQETVEGLSVVAISYYAVNLLSKLFYPIAKKMNIETSWLSAGLVPPVVLVVWLVVRRIKRMAEKRSNP